MSKFFSSKINLQIVVSLIFSTVFGQEKNTKFGVFGALWYGKYYDSINYFQYQNKI